MKIITRTLLAAGLTVASVVSFVGASQAYTEARRVEALASCVQSSESVVELTMSTSVDNETRSPWFEQAKVGLGPDCTDVPFTLALHTYDGEVLYQEGVADSEPYIIPVEVRLHTGDFTGADVFVGGTKLGTRPFYLQAGEPL